MRASIPELSSKKKLIQLRNLFLHTRELLSKYYGIDIKIASFEITMKIKSKKKLIRISDKNYLSQFNFSLYNKYDLKYLRYWYKKANEYILIRYWYKFFMIYQHKNA